MPSTFTLRLRKPITSRVSPSSLPREPRGIDGSIRALAWNVESTRKLSSDRSRTDPQPPQAIVSVCSRPRTVSGPPQWGQASVRTFGTSCGDAGAVASGAVSPAIESPQSGQSERIEFDVLTDEQQRRRLAVVEGREAPSGTLQIGDRRVVARLDAKRQLSLTRDAARALDVDHLVAVAAENDRLSNLERSERRQRLVHRGAEGNRVVASRLAEPAVAHVVEEQMPFVPKARVESILNPPHHREMNPREFTPAPELQRRAVGLEVRHAAHVLEVEVVTHESRLAIRADRDHRSRRAKHDLRAARRTVDLEPHLRRPDRGGNR